jgi:hypothetical protein
MIVMDESLDHEYLSIDGLKTFTEASVRLILGADSPAIKEQRVRYILINSLFISMEAVKPFLEPELVVWALIFSFNLHEDQY